MTRFYLFFKIRKNIFTILLFMFVIETALFLSLFSLQKKLAQNRIQLENSDIKLKNIMSIIQKHDSTQFFLVKDIPEGIIVIKDILSVNKMPVQNITVLSSREYIIYSVSGESDYVKFIRFLSAIRKTTTILRINSYMIKFTSNGNVNYTIGIQAMKNTTLRANVK